MLVPKPLSNAFYWLFELNNRFHCYDDVDKKDGTNHDQIFQYQPYKQQKVIPILLQKTQQRNLKTNVNSFFTTK